MLDLRNSCYEYINPCPICEGNLTLLVTNTSTLSELTNTTIPYNSVITCSVENQCPDSNCTFWYNEFEVFPSYQCMDDTIDTTAADYITHSTNLVKIFKSDIDVGVVRNDFCMELSSLTSLPFLSEQPYCVLSLLIAAMISMIGIIMIIYIAPWRIKISCETRYDSWMSLTSLLKLLTT